MLELFLLFIGTRFIRRKWWVVGLIGLVWMALGAFFFADAFVDEIRIPPTYFAIPLVIDASLTLAMAFFAKGSGRPARFARAALFLGIVLLLVEAPWHSDMAIGLLVGTFLIVDAISRGASAYIMRYTKWQISLFNAVFEFFMGVWSLVPWPSQWLGEAGSDIGFLLIVSAINICSLAYRLRNLPPDMTISQVLMRGFPPLTGAVSGSPDRSGRERETASAVIHVWTPTGALVPINRGISRYVAALDERGVISTGHAALELPPDVYISHYPAVEIERSRSAFTRVLRATPENDVPGLFQPSYREESANWCASTLQVRLHGLDAQALRDFWTVYRMDETYNLTDRNCSSAVAKALDAGLEGIFEAQAYSPLFLIKLFLTPELWIAGMMRRRAATMTWTPGFVLDYARVLSHIVALIEEPPGARHDKGDRTVTEEGLSRP